MSSTIESFDIEIESWPGVIMVASYVMLVLKFLDHVRLVWRVKRDSSATPAEVAYTVQTFEAVLRTIVIGVPFGVTFIVIANSILDSELPLIMNVALILWVIFLLIAVVYWYAKRLKSPNDS